MALGLALVARLVGVEHALQRRLGVDHHVLAARHAHDEIGTKRSVAGAERRLLDEVAMTDHSRQLDHVAELHLAPLPSRVGLAQRRHERAGLGTEPLPCFRERAELSLQPATRLATVLIELDELVVDTAQLAGGRSYELLNGPLPTFALALGVHLPR